MKWMEIGKKSLRIINPTPPPRLVCRGAKLSVYPKSKMEANIAESSLEIHVSVNAIIVIFVI